MSTFQEISDNILTKTLETVQNFPLEERVLLMQEEYLFLHDIVNGYNVGKEWTATDTDNNFYDQTLTAGLTELAQLKTGTIRKVEFQIVGESYWRPARRTSVRAYEATCGSLSERLATVCTPDEFIERDGNIELVGQLATDATVRIWISEELVLPTTADLTGIPRLPLFAHVMLELSPAITYMERHNMQGVNRYTEMYTLRLNRLMEEYKQTTPPKKFKMKSVRRK